MCLWFDSVGQYKRWWAWLKVFVRDVDLWDLDNGQSTQTEHDEQDKDENEYSELVQ